MKQEISVIGIDIAQRVFHFVGLDSRGQIVLRKRCSRCNPQTFHFCWN